MIDDDRPFIIESPTRIRLNPTAIHFAHEYGLDLKTFAKYLLHQNRHHHYFHADHAEFEPVVTPEVSVQNVNLTDGELHAEGR